MQGKIGQESASYVLVNEHSKFDFALFSTLY
jgi:hypothetical protein